MGIAVDQRPKSGSPLERLEMLQRRASRARLRVFIGGAIRYGSAVVGCVLITLIALALQDTLALANIVMLYLLATVGVAIRFGRGPAATAAVLNVAAFDFFCVPPRYSFSVVDAQYLITFSVMLVVGLLTGQLMAGLRAQAAISASRDRRSQSLFELTRELSGALLASQVAKIGQSAVQQYFGGDAVVLVSDRADALQPTLQSDPGFDAATAEWAFRQGRPAGLATATFADQPWHYAPLQAPMRVRGVLALRPAQVRSLLIPEKRQHLETLARQIAIALERVHYVEVSRDALLEMESERLRNALLASISHDLRTPLTALIGLAESLTSSEPPLRASQAETAQAVAQQARELATLVSNLLEMARLQSGSIKLRLQWESVEELVGGALHSLRSALKNSRVDVHVPADFPLVQFDATLMQRALANLVENALRHGAPPIVITAQAEEEAMVLSVRDHGPGLPSSLNGKEHLLFEKFTRGETESSTPGVGLGLAICKAIVEAHRGSISARNMAPGGAEFVVRIPRQPPPQIQATA